MKPSLIPSPVPYPSQGTSAGGLRPSLPQSSRPSAPPVTPATQRPDVSQPATPSGLKPSALPSGQPPVPKPVAPAPSVVHSMLNAQPRPANAPAPVPSFLQRQKPALTTTESNQAGFVPSLGSALNKEHYAILLTREGCDIETIALAKVIMDKHGRNILDYGETASDDLIDIQSRLLKATNHIDEQIVSKIVDEIAPGLWKRLNAPKTQEATRRRVERVQSLLNSLEDGPEKYRTLSDTVAKILAHADKTISVTSTLIGIIEKKETDPLILQQCALRRDALQTLQHRIIVTTEQVRQIAQYATITAKTLTTIKTAVADWMQKINSEAMPNGAECVEQIRDAMRSLHA